MYMPPPPELNRKIAIIGSGPSGIFTCYFLNKLGYTNIHLYGDINDAQPKTIMVDDIVCDVTTTYTNYAYRNSIYKLLKEYNIDFKNVDNTHFQLLKKNEYTKLSFTLYDKIMTTNLIPHYILHKIIKDTEFSKHIYNINFEDYKNKYMTSQEFFTLDMLAWRYGFFKDVSAYHLIKWIKPISLLTNQLSSNDLTIKMINKGFGTLFNTIYDSLETKRKINKKVIKVSKNQLITENNKTKHYDDIFVCCPLSSIKTPLHENINNDKHITYSKIFTYMFETTTKHKELNHICFLQDVIQKNTINHPLTIRYINKTIDGTTCKSDKHIYFCFGYCETFNEDKVKPIIQKELKGYGFDIKTDFYFKIYKYNYRFTEKAIEEGVHLYVNEQQGKDGLYYLGGMLSHWDVDSIYEHSREIVNHFHLNNTSNPIDKLQTFANIQYNKWIDEW